MLINALCCYVHHSEFSMRDLLELSMLIGHTSSYKLIKWHNTRETKVLSSDMIYFYIKSFIDVKGIVN